MDRPASLREPMDMPDPQFPFKIHTTRVDGNGKTLFPHHWHGHIEFLYFTSGKAMIECNSVPLSVQAGELVVVNSNDLHYGISQSDHLSYYALIVDISLLHSQSVDAVETKFITPITQNRILFINKISNDEDINRCMISLIHEWEAKELGYELSIKSYLYRILTILLRKYAVNILTLNDYNLRMKNLERYAPIFQYIDEHYNKELSVELLAGMAGLSRFHFSRLFKELTDRTVTEYINLIRINKSAYLLRNTRMNISEIALSTGFNDIYYFSRIFKKYKKVPPSDLRRTLLRNTNELI
ncbi:MAG TPA: AraC family transcriptional regulator [Bacilli bacterium]